MADEQLLLEICKVDPGKLNEMFGLKERPKQISDDDTIELSSKAASSGSDDQHSG